MGIPHWFFNTAIVVLILGSCAWEWKQNSRTCEIVDVISAITSIKGEVVTVTTFSGKEVTIDQYKKNVIGSKSRALTVGDQICLQWN